VPVPVPVPVSVRPLLSLRSLLPRACAALRSFTSPFRADCRSPKIIDGPGYHSVPTDDSDSDDRLDRKHCD
jgi:hypothetical protein